MSNPSETAKTPIGHALLTKTMEVEQHIGRCRKLADILSRNLVGMNGKTDASEAKCKTPQDFAGQMRHHLDRTSSEVVAIEALLRELIGEFNISGENIPGRGEEKISPREGF